jgi:hypothetical protein
MNILSIIKYKNLEDITKKELEAFQLLIEEAIHSMNELQRMYRELTGREYVPPIRLVPEQRKEK